MPAPSIRWPPDSSSFVPANTPSASTNTWPAKRNTGGTFTLGAVTPTYDLESEPVDLKPWEHLTVTDIRKATEAFTGDILQVPPTHSAIKRDGKPAYLMARKGQDVVLEPRPIRISTFEITGVEGPVVTFRVVCSTGTYIRSLAFDMGRALGCGAYLSALRRTRIGEFSVDDAMSVQTFVDRITEEKEVASGNV